MSGDIGPLEFMLFAFEGNRFDGAISASLTDLVDDGLIRIVDLAVISKNAEGDVAILEMQELTEEVADAMIALQGHVSGLMSEADLLEMAEALEPETTAAALLYESLWASRFAQAIRTANGQLLLSERIPHDVVAAARATLIQAAAGAGAGLQAQGDA